jgi:hypothetical protein
MSPTKRGSRGAVARVRDLAQAAGEEGLQRSSVIVASSCPRANAGTATPGMIRHMIRSLTAAAALLLLAGCTSGTDQHPARASTPPPAVKTSATPTPTPTYTDPAGATARTCTEFQQLLATLKAAPPSTDLATLKSLAKKIQTDAANASQLSGNDPRYDQLTADAAALANYLNGPTFAKAGGTTGAPVQAMQDDCPAS